MLCGREAAAAAAAAEAERLRAEQEAAERAEAERVAREAEKRELQKLERKFTLRLEGKVAVGLPMKVMAQTMFCTVLRKKADLTGRVGSILCASEVHTLCKLPVLQM